MQTLTVVIRQIVSIRKFSYQLTQSIHILLNIMSTIYTYIHMRLKSQQLQLRSPNGMYLAKFRLREKTRVFFTALYLNRAPQIFIVRQRNINYFKCTGPLTRISNLFSAIPESRFVIPAHQCRQHTRSITRVEINCDVIE